MKIQNKRTILKAVKAIQYADSLIELIDREAAEGMVSKEVADKAKEYADKMIFELELFTMGQIHCVKMSDKRISRHQNKSKGYLAAVYETMGWNK